MNDFSTVPLWRQMQATSQVLLAVRQGRSLTEALQQTEGVPRPGVQACLLYTSPSPRDS